MDNPFIEQLFYLVEQLFYYYNTPMKNNSGNSKERLIQAATKLFAQKGFKATTVREIASLADIRESQINHHFGSKEDLFQACLEGLEDSRLEYVEVILSQPAQSTADLQARLMMLINGLLEAHLSKYDQMKMLYFMELTEGVFPEAFQKKWVKLFKDIASFIERSKTTGVIKKEIDSKFFVELIYNNLSYTMLFHEYSKGRSGIDLFKDKDRMKFIQKHLDLLVPAVVQG